MSPASGGAGAGLVKCVVWDIDNTLLNGIYLESPDAPPAAHPVTAAALTEFAARGILHAIVSKNPREAAAYTAEVTGREFAAVECGWGRKSDAVARIAADLGIGADSLAFVDDDPYERAEVAAAMPEVLVLSPEEVTEAAGWPEFGAAAATDEARRRGEMYAARRRRQDAARAFGGSQQDFLASAGTQVTLAPAIPADRPRLHELAARTRQFNSAGRRLTEAELDAMTAAADASVVTVRLRDAFGDDGIVGAAVTGDPGDGVWTVRLLMMSCRAMGRGVIGALLAWLTRSAARAGVRELTVPCALHDRNLPLRLALVAAGFRADGPGGAAPAGAATGPAADGAADGTPADGMPARAVFRREVGTSLPELPSWVTGPGEPGPGEPGPGEPGPGEPGPDAVAAVLREILAAVTCRPELAGVPADAALFGDEVALDSLTGTLLLREVHRRFGVDVAAADLNLDSLASLGTLAGFVAGRRPDARQ